LGQSWHTSRSPYIVRCRHVVRFSAVGNGELDDPDAVAEFRKISRLSRQKAHRIFAHDVKLPSVVFGGHDGDVIIVEYHGEGERFSFVRM